MQPFCIVQELAADPSAYWSLHFNPSFNRAFYDAVDIDLEVLKDERDAARILREVRYSARTPVPSYLRRLLPDGLGYVEHAEFDRASQLLRHTIVPTTAAARTDIRASLRVESTGAGSSRRIYEGTVAIDVPLLGARLERNTVKNIATSQERAGVVTTEWLARHADGPAPLSPTPAQV